MAATARPQRENAGDGLSNQYAFYHAVRATGRFATSEAESCTSNMKTGELRRSERGPLREEKRHNLTNRQSACWLMKPQAGQGTSHWGSHPYPGTTSLEDCPLRMRVKAWVTMEDADESAHAIWGTTEAQDRLEHTGLTVRWPLSGYRWSIRSAPRLHSDSKGWKIRREFVDAGVEVV